MLHVLSNALVRLIRLYGLVGDHSLRRHGRHGLLICGEICHEGAGDPWMHLDILGVQVP